MTRLVEEVVSLKMVTKHAVISLIDQCYILLTMCMKAHTQGKGHMFLCVLGNDEATRREHSIEKDQNRYG